ncbi:hypothetical protein B0H10DRAFT_1939388 [Mycena sp. CBHHK59/15]|nr:hypothetical protein B0H10DRAFT_1939388 [Mycena sp. CBHHK59/15]
MTSQFPGSDDSYSAPISSELDPTYEVLPSQKQEIQRQEEREVHCARARIREVRGAGAPVKDEESASPARTPRATAVTGSATTRGHYAAALNSQVTSQQFVQNLYGERGINMYLFHR